MLTQAIAFVLDALFSLFILAALVRFWMQALRAPARNPIAQFTMALTDWAVKPLRRVIPGVFNLDWASLAVAWAFEFLLQFLLLMLVGGSPIENPAVLSVLLVLAFVKLVRLSIYVFIGAVIIQAVLSWVNPKPPGDAVLRCDDPALPAARSPRHSADRRRRHLAGARPHLLPARPDAPGDVARAGAQQHPCYGRPRACFSADFSAPFPGFSCARRPPNTRRTRLCCMRNVRVKRGARSASRAGPRPTRSHAMIATHEFALLIAVVLPYRRPAGGERGALPRG